MKFDQLVSEVKSKVNVNEADIKYVERMTKQQRKSNLWHKVRTGRITGSICQDVQKTDRDKPAPSVMKKICAESSVKFTLISSLRWGIDHEDVAMVYYKVILSEIHKEFKITTCGFKISESTSCIAATPGSLFQCRVPLSLYF